MNNDIDIVIIWVDGSDKKWLAEKRKYQNESFDKKSEMVESGSEDSRFRDWDNLKYVFRSIEKYAPWVRKVHFVTCGHLPNWLDTSNPKLNIVKHSDFIPKKYLPTFNSHTIELNLHRIEGLAEQFIYFNDDMLFLRPTKKSHFFKNGKPCQTAIMDASCVTGNDTALAKIYNMCPLNKNFNKKTVINKNFFKWFNIKYGTKIVKNICLYPFRHFTGFYEMHIPNSFLKTTFETVWEKEYEILDSTCMNKFRGSEQVSQWLLENWQAVEGNFVPRSVKFGFAGRYNENDETILKIIEKQKYYMLCVNDDEKIKDFELAKHKLNSTFDKILGEKSSFEK